MKIAVFGAGGVGAYFGGLLAQNGHEVTFIARGEHLRAMQSEGLRVFSVNGDFHIHPAQAVDESASIETPEYLVVAVKHYQLSEALDRIATMAGPGTTVVPLLNGVDAQDVLAAALGLERVVGGLCSLVSYVESPGVVRQESQLRRVVIGELDRGRSERVDRLVRAWQATGVDAIQAEGIWSAIWRKFLFIAAFGGITSAAQVNAGELLGCQESHDLFVEAMREIEAVGRANGIDLPAESVPQALAMIMGFEPTATSSMQRDVAAGRLFELEAFSGKIVRLGEELGVPTPIHATLYALLRPVLLRAMRGS